MAEQLEWIVDATLENFESAVIERSKDVPVVIDLWATWCQPCRQLAPILERLIQEQGGKIVLAKVNVDEQPEIAESFGVQSLPSVIVIRHGRPIDQFQGLIPEQEIRAWLENMLPSPAEEHFTRGQALEENDPAGAAAAYREAARLAPENGLFQIQLARTLLAQDCNDECAGIISKLEERGYLEPDAEKIKSQLDLRSAAKEAGGVEEARNAAEASPDDLSQQLKLADALAVGCQHQEALEICLTLIQRDKTGIGGEAKETMVKIFDMLEPDSELVSTYRRKLATAYY